MDLNYLKSIVKIFDNSKATELSITEDGVEIYMSSSQEMPIIQQAPVYQQMQQSAPTPVNQVKEITTPQSNEKPSDEVSGLHIVHSPMVGTFYRAPSPDSANYVEIGATVGKGNVLCIIEAMKLMNEIESDCSGTIEKIFIENGQPVEYNQPLFAIKQ